MRKIIRRVILFSWLSLFKGSLLASPCEAILEKLHPRIYDQFEPQISLTNEGSGWRRVRDQMIGMAQAHPDRYVVSTGLQQSLELAFSGVSKVVMVDAYGPSVASFALFSDLAKRFENSDDFFRELQKHLKKGGGKSGEAAKSYVMESDTPAAFIKIFKAFGEKGYQRFREAALAGTLKFLHEDVSDSEWATKVRELTEGQAPSSIYISNILNWLSDPQQNQSFRRNLEQLGFDRSMRRSFFGLTSREEINFGSYIAHMFLNIGDFSFLPQFQRLDEAGLLRSGLSQNLRFSETYSLEPQIRQEFPREFENRMIRIRSRLNNEVIDEGFLSRDSSGKLRFMGGDVSDENIFFNSNIHQIEEISGENWPMFFQSRIGQTVHIVSKTSGTHYNIKIEGINLDRYRYRFDGSTETLQIIGRLEGSSEPTRLNFIPSRHEIVTETNSINTQSR